jgi:Ni,Fe-hydrogenase III large subunit
MSVKSPSKIKAKRRAQRTLAVGSNKLFAAISEERILQLLNDAAEDIKSGDVREWRRVARYLQDEFQKLQNHLNAIRPTVAAMSVGFDLMAHGKSEMRQWLERMKEADAANS